MTAMSISEWFRNKIDDLCDKIFETEEFTLTGDLIDDTQISESMNKNITLSSESGAKIIIEKEKWEELPQECKNDLYKNGFYKQE